MKEATLYFDFTMNLNCPHCGKYVDVDEDDEDRVYLDLFKKWLNNVAKDKMGLENFKDICPHCNEEFGVSEIER